MKKIFLFTALPAFAALAFLACGDGSEKTPAAAGSDNAQVASANGAALYQDKCTLCHGADGKAAVMGASDLSKSTLDHAGMVNVVTNGRKTMRSFGNELNAQEIEAVVKYAESLRK